MSEVSVDTAWPHLESDNYPPIDPGYKTADLTIDRIDHTIEVYEEVIVGMGAAAQKAVAEERIVFDETDYLHPLINYYDAEQ